MKGNQTDSGDSRQVRVLWCTWRQLTCWVVNENVAVIWTSALTLLEGHPACKTIRSSICQRFLSGDLRKTERTYVNVGNWPVKQKMRLAVVIWACSATSSDYDELHWLCVLHLSLSSAIPVLLLHTGCQCSPLQSASHHLVIVLRCSQSTCGCHAFSIAITPSHTLGAIHCWRWTGC